MAASKSSQHSVMLALASMAMLTSVYARGEAATSYEASTKYLGCYSDPKVTILTSAKLSTIAMTPQFCADWCGQRGFPHSGIEFGTQCFCGAEPDLSDATRTDDGDCNTPCPLEPSSSCGATYVMSLYQIVNPQGGSPDTRFVPACQRRPLSSHPVCNTALSIPERVKSLVNSLTQEEKILNLMDAAAGSERLGLPSYEWWSEATHGVGSAPGVQFTRAPANFSSATSFPAPILTAASFDDALFHDIGEVTGKEGRAFANNGFSGFDFWAPNINAFRDPRWGRGQETPGEDVLVAQNYVRGFVQGLQGDDPKEKQVIATCKHFAVYDIETDRYGNNFNPTQQELGEYFLPPFKTCARDSGVGSVMCAYNAVFGVPACASEYLLGDVLRDHWNFTADYNYVVSDCTAVTEIWQSHNFTNSAEEAASVALNSGVDLECGSSYLKLNESLASNHTSIETLDRSLQRLYSALFTVGFFDGGKYTDLDYADVSTPSAQILAYAAAVEGMTLLKNDGLLPLGTKHHFKTVAVIGPYGNATTQMQGDYSGMAPHIVSPLEAFQSASQWGVNYAQGTTITNETNTGFDEALRAAEKSDLIVFLGGIDNSLENEGLDRKSLAWPQNQMDLMTELAKTKKPMIVVQFGGGQVDDSALLQNDHVNAIVWAGYPSQSGGTALLDILQGKVSIAGRLPVTQYPASYADQVSLWDLSLRPNANTSYPGRTYKWYTGEPVLPFGYGLHYTKFEYKWEEGLHKQYNIQELVGSCKGKSGGSINDVTPFASVKVRVRNVGHEDSDYVSLLFLSSPDAGPAPHPSKTLVAYSRLHGIKKNHAQTTTLNLNLGSLARADEKGSLVIYPGHYKLVLDVDESLALEFSLHGDPEVIETLPEPQEQYDYTVPVHIQPPSTGPL
ncbi:putative beta-xylosidase [Penicillium oxalicum 114-2]|uniref:xylan 1,4-beta-xylosidase n=1 Tax=Penicillium oxalicum (strain 114-2 / CGMCC 5302) TaxID=933388 RepID=S7ZQR7_PENO1|nr:putative beta-xylosidase [Penicillium oxalicum 114-2]